MPHKAKHRGTTRRRRAAKSAARNVTRTAALGGVAAAVPVIGFAAAPAHAATVDTWDRLAQCESSGDWQINTGNGYYGGVQFAASTWREFGGGKFASRADLATKAEQIAIAEKVLDVQGWNAWPACSRKLGLGADDKVGNPGAPSTADRADTAARASRGARAGAVGAKSAPTAKKAPSGKSYTVRPGDTLSKIARAHSVEGGWRALWKLNRSVLGSDPNLIFPDQKLRVAGKAAPSKPAKAPADSARTKASKRASRSGGQQATQPQAKNWVLPIESYHLTGRFGASGSNWSSSHHGLDFAAPSGTPIRAVGAGEIVSADQGGAYGNHIKVEHADGTVTLYGHMTRFARTSGSVSAGTVIGYVGATGNATGPHLHLEVRPDGGGLDDTVDPFEWLSDKGLRP